jgi:exopolyphosphatase/pppGpp-phosphohydrolase
MTGSVRIAAIDIGSDTVHLLVAVTTSVQSLEDASRPTMALWATIGSPSRVV